MKVLRIFSTKKLSPRLAEMLRNDPRVEYAEADFIRTEIVTSVPAAQPMLDGKNIFIFTSPRAVSAAAQLYPHLKAAAIACYCLEGATCNRIVYKFPQAKVLATADAAAHLAEKIVAATPGVPLLFFCGNRRHNALPDILSAAGLRLEELPVYQTFLQPQQVEGKVDALLFFSPSAVESFLQCNRISPGTVCFAPGETTAAAILQQTGFTAQIAASPSQEEILVNVFRYFKISFCVPTEE